MNDKQRFLKLAKETFKDFTTKETSLTLKVYYEGSEVLSSTDRTFTNYFFSVFSKLKKELRANKEHIENLPLFYAVEPERINYYFSCNRMPETDIYILDLRSAYISIAYRLGMISKELYEEINKLPKKERLVILGMIASNPYYSEYKDSELISTKRIKTDAYLYQIFIYIQYELGLFMFDLREIFIQDVVYYWVDEIAFYPELLPEIEDFVKDKFEYKTTFNKCEIKEYEKMLYILIDGKQKLVIPKAFTLPEFVKNMIKKQYEKDN